MKLKLHTPRPGDKWLQVTDEDNPCGVFMRIDYDDVDQETVLRDAQALIEKVNSFKSCQSERGKSNPTLIRVFIGTDNRVKDAWGLLCCAFHVLFLGGAEIVSDLPNAQGEQRR